MVPSQRPRAAASALRPSSLCCCCFLAESCLTFKTPWTVACQAPRPWNSPGRNTGVGCHLLLQGMLVALHCGWTLHRRATPGSPVGHHPERFTFIVSFSLYGISFGPDTAFPKDSEFFTSLHPQSRSCRASTVNVLTLQTAVQGYREGS